MIHEQIRKSGGTENKGRTATPQTWEEQG